MKTQLKYLILGAALTATSSVMALDPNEFFAQDEQTQNALVGLIRSVDSLPGTTLEETPEAVEVIIKTDSNSVAIATSEENITADEIDQLKDALPVDTNMFWILNQDLTETAAALQSKGFTPVATSLTQLTLSDADLATLKTTDSAVVQATTPEQLNDWATLTSRISGLSVEQTLAIANDIKVSAEFNTNVGYAPDNTPITSSVSVQQGSNLTMLYTYNDPAYTESAQAAYRFPTLSSIDSLTVYASEASDYENFGFTSTGAKFDIYTFTK
jgi:hypothetical protein